MKQETVLIHLRTNQVFVLNHTAARLWTLIGEGKSVGEARQAILDEFAVDEGQLDAEIEKTLAELLDRNLLGDADVG